MSLNNEPPVGKCVTSIRFLAGINDPEQTDAFERTARRKTRANVRFNSLFPFISEIYLIAFPTEFLVAEKLIITTVGVTDTKIAK
ncbi:hypothetical protein T05_11855 [Trichinella murrelli]|uniref:Uncharacterized protein n=1 Tax=Trichinella murrelli TaxID=144512 RepID=A0A0V0TV13_9BILA|nr:hypothetical protein T05_11855 [Trichinella murrelli]